MVKKQTSAKYNKKNRNAPPYIASECKNMRKKGNNGEIYISKKDKNGSWRWYKIKTRMRSNSRPLPIPQSTYYDPTLYYTAEEYYIPSQNEDVIYEGIYEDPIDSPHIQRLKRRLQQTQSEPISLRNPISPNNRTPYKSSPLVNKKKKKKSVTKKLKRKFSK